MNINTNMNNNTKEVNNMKYSITKINGDPIYGTEHATLCERCGKHFVIASIWDVVPNYCAACMYHRTTQTRYAMLYVDGQCVAFDSLSQILDYYQAAPCLNMCVTLVSITIDYPCFIDSAFRREIESDLQYEAMLEEMRKSDYEELADSDWPF